MKLIIDIDEEDFNKVVNTTDKFITLKTNITESIKNGIPLKEKVGHWIPVYDKNGIQENEEYYGEIYKCSECGGTDFNSYYCPYCGAKMENGDVGGE